MSPGTSRNHRQHQSSVRHVFFQKVATRSRSLAVPLVSARLRSINRAMSEPKNSSASPPPA